MSCLECAIYNEVKSNGLQSGLDLTNKLFKDEAYASDNWLSNLADIGWILMMDGYGDEALAFYDMALEKNPAHLSSLLRKGDALVIAEKYDEALDHYRKERSLEARARFTHLPHMIKLLSGDFELIDMK